MKRLVLCSFLILVLVCVSFNLYSAETKMQRRIDNAADIVQSFNNAIPDTIIQKCMGIAILNIYKGGFILGARGGDGIVIAKDVKGNWTGPSAINLAGGSIGLQIGAEETDFVVVLMKDAAVKAFYKDTATLGGNLSVAAGPGTTAESEITDTDIFTYSRTKGVFAGMSLEGAAFGADKDINAEFYNNPAVTPEQILSGTIPRPASCQSLVDALSTYIIPKAEPVTK